MGQSGSTVRRSKVMRASSPLPRRSHTRAPSAVPTSMSRRHLAALLALSAIWGASFMFIKVGVRDFEPGALIAVRIGLAAVTLIAVVAWRPGLRAGVRAVRGFVAPLIAVGA